MLAKSPDIALINETLAGASARRVHTVPGDGACLFNSVNVHLAPNYALQSAARRQADSLRLRHATVQYIRNHEADYLPTILADHDDLDVYLLEMSLPKTYADATMYSALSAMLDCNIVLVNADFAVHEKFLMTGWNPDHTHVVYVRYSTAAQHYDAVVGIQGSMLGADSPPHLRNIHWRGVAVCNQLDGSDDDDDNDDDDDLLDANKPPVHFISSVGAPNGMTQAPRRCTSQVDVQPPSDRRKPCDYKPPGGTPCGSTFHKTRNHCVACHQLTDHHAADCEEWLRHKATVARRNAPLPPDNVETMTASLKRTTSAHPRPCQHPNCGRVLCVGVSNHCKDCGSFVNDHARDCPAIVHLTAAADSNETPAGFDRAQKMTYVQFNLIKLKNHCPRQWIDDVVREVEELRKNDLADNFMFVLERGANELHLHLQGVVGLRVAPDETNSYNLVRGHFARRLNLDVNHHKNGTSTGWKKANLSFLVKTLWTQTPTNIINAASSVVGPHFYTWAHALCDNMVH